MATSDNLSLKSWVCLNTPTNWSWVGGGGGEQTSKAIPCWNLNEQLHRETKETYCGDPKVQWILLFPRGNFKNIWYAYPGYSTIFFLIA